MEYFVSPIYPGAAAEIVRWQYPPPYAVYDMNESSLPELLDGSYYAVSDAEGHLVGYYCFGASAQVPAGRPHGVYPEGYMDIGLGIRPDLCGRGQGFCFLLRGLDFARAELYAVKFRLTVASFNARATRLYEKAGFQTAAAFIRHDIDDRAFRVMTLE